jgi:bacteriocin biosynthesis cyclodehydratase domain-containing protein
MALSLPELPLIKRHLFTTVIGDDEVFILAEDRAWLWKSHGLGFLLPELNGLRTVSDLFELLGSEVTPPEIIYLLNQLHDLGLLASGPPSPAPDCAGTDVGFWHALGASDDGAPERIRRSRIRLRVASPMDDTRFLFDALFSAGIVAVDDGEVALEVVVTDHYFRPELTRVNDAALRSGSAWMVCKLAGQTLWIGPIFKPGQTGCLACLQDRLRLNRQVEDYVVRSTGDSSYYRTSLGSLPPMARLGATWVAQEIASWLAGRTNRLEGKLLSINFGAKGLEITDHVLVRRPQCRACGASDQARQVLPLLLRRGAAGSFAHGDDRIEPPEITLRRLSHHISPITGVVTWLSDLSRDPDGVVHSCSAGHHFTFGLDTIFWLRQSLRPRTGGKGATATQARVSAVCEAIEQYCGVFRDDVHRIRQTYEALGSKAVHPYRCLNFSARQYDCREQLNSDDREGFFHRIPRRFHEDLEIDWVALWSLTHEEIRYLPAALCYYGHPDVERHFYCAADGNGCAAGNVLEEAVFYAFLELVERDSAAIWWYNQLARPAIDLDSALDPYIAHVREHYQRHGRELWAIDITSDFGIPVIAAVSRRVDGPTADLLIGLGAHLDPAIALLRAVTEVNQFLPAVSRRYPNGETLYAWPDDVAVRFWKKETLASQPHLVPNPDLQHRTLAQFHRLANADLYDSIQTCLGIIRRHGLEMMVLDQSRPDIDLAVVRVVVPGLRHFWRRLGPGRLYDVPVQLGWVAAPKAEGDLNPTSIFF